MKDVEFDNYLADALSELEVKQDQLESKFSIGHHEQFVVNYEDDSLFFFEKEKPVVEAKILPIASHIKEKEHLKWFWANTNLPDKVKKKGEPIKILHDITGYDLFLNNYVNEVDEYFAYEIAALSCKALEAKGIYIVPHASLNTYVLITDIKHNG